MKKIVKIAYINLSIIFLIYLIIPNFDFPRPPEDSLQSFEPADTENILRKAYFTNYTRDEVINYYENQFKKSSFLNIPLPTYRLNYPPEESKTIIRDQTRSTFLEEIVHPLRESIFINGFEPKLAKDAIFVGGKNWRQKIIIKYIPSNAIIRVFVGLTVLLLIPVIWNMMLSDLNELIRTIKKIWI